MPSVTGSGMNFMGKKKIKKVTIRLPSLFLGQKWGLISACMRIRVPDMLMGKKDVYIVRVTVSKMAAAIENKGSCAGPVSEVLQIHTIIMLAITE
jgi:hypothetical protein